MSEALPPEFRTALTVTRLRRGCFGEPTYFLTETTSTNDVASGLARRGATEGTTVIAMTQHAGRGRHGRSWFSPPGAGIYASVICRDRSAAPLLTLAAGVAVAEGIRAATSLPVEIKWPNDIVMARQGSPLRLRKLAGILAEASTNGEGLQHVVLGFGVNVRPAEYPADLADRATSVETELGRPADAFLICAEILAALNAQVRLASGDAGALLVRWRALAPSAVGSRVEWDRGTERRRGTAAGIDDQGALLVRTGGGATERIRSGEVRWL